MIHHHFQIHVAPLTPGAAPYTPISSLHGGIASLHSSPMHSARQRPQRHPQSGSVDLGDLSGYEYSPLSSKDSHDLDLRAEVDRHRANLQQFRDWFEIRKNFLDTPWVALCEDFKIGRKESFPKVVFFEKEMAPIWRWNLYIFVY